MKLPLRGGLHSMRTNAGRDRDPAFDDLGDSFWLGGEAMVAPVCLSALRDSALRDARRPADDECADPGWLVI
jgi:hypothetical protein